MDRAPCEKAAGAGPGITGYIRSHLWVSIMGSLMLLLVVSFRLDSFAKAFPYCCF